MSTSFSRLCDALTARPRRWLVTGAAGFIGSALVEELCALGQEVTALDNLSTGYRGNLDMLDQSFDFIEGDIRDSAACMEACKGIDYVLHQAAFVSVPGSIANPQTNHEINVNGTLNVFLAAHHQGVKRLVFASSSAVYGDAPELPAVENSVGRALSPYAVSKRMGELYADVLFQTHKLETVGLRYFNIFGKRQDPTGDYAAVIPRWIQALISDEQCIIYGDGKTSRDFCHIDNVVQANLLAAAGDNPVANQIFNVGCGYQVTLTQLLDAICEQLMALGISDANNTPIYAKEREGDIRHLVASIDKLVDATGYEPSHDIHSGLRETVAWFVDQHDQS